MVLRIITLLVLLGLFPLSSSGQDIRKHFLVFYDNSAPFVRIERTNDDLRSALKQVLSGDLNVDAKGDVSLLQTELQRGVPIFDPNNDDISFFFFGIRETDSNDIINRTPQPKAYKKFKESFVQKVGESWSAVRNNYNNDVKSYLGSRFSAERPSWRNGHTFSQFIYPLALDLDLGDNYTKEYVIVILSDFLTGTQYIDRDDHVLNQLFGTSGKYQAISEPLKKLRGNFLKFDYFKFSFPRTDRYRQSVLHGISAFRIKPMAGDLEPEALPIQFNSGFLLNETSFESNIYNLDEVSISVPHNQSLKVDNISLEILNSKKQSVVTLNDLKFSKVSASNYTLSPVNLALDDVGNDTLTIRYQLRSSFETLPSRKVKFLHTLDRSLNGSIIRAPEPAIDQTNYIGLGIAGAVLILIGLSIFVINGGKPTHIDLEIERFGDSYQEVDFSSADSKHGDYVAWTDHEESIRVSGRISRGLFLTKGFWNSPLYFELVNVNAPSGFQVQVSDKDEVLAVEGTKLKIKPSQLGLNDNFSFFVEIKNEDHFHRIDKPLYLSFGIRAIYAKDVLFLKSEHESYKRYKFYVGPDLGDSWIGLDPGTTGSCLAAGTGIQEIVLMSKDGKEIIEPSTITFDRNPKAKARLNRGLQALTYKDSEAIYYYGAMAEQFKDGKYAVSFQSNKKRLGYKDEKIIKYESGLEVSIKGDELTTLLLKGVLNDFKSYVELHSNRWPQLIEEAQYNPQRAVVAIPNNFTGTKIQNMIESVKEAGAFQEIRYIYEAEAVLLYYLRYKKSIGVSSTNETVLIFDMGGATINATMVGLETIQSGNHNENYKIDILGKIGYGIGGDTIDYALIKLIYSFDKDYPILKDYYPFEDIDGMDDEEKEDQRRLRKTMSKIALELKKDMIRGFYDPSQESILTAIDINSAFRGADIELNTMAGDDLLNLFEKNENGIFEVFEHALFQELVFENVRKSVEDLTAIVDLYPGKVIFSGRSTLFPQIKETVMTYFSAQQQNVSMVNMDPVEVKTAVAKGACIYGIIKDSVQLNHHNVGSSFGFTETVGLSNIKYHELIKMNDRFRKNGSGIAECEKQKTLDRSFENDNHHINFYQFMGRNHQEIIDRGEKHKYAFLGKVKVKAVAETVGMKVFENDKVLAEIQETGRKKSAINLMAQEQEIAQANDEHYTWILD